MLIATTQNGTQDLSQGKSEDGVGATIAPPQIKVDKRGFGKSLRSSEWDICPGQPSSLGRRLVRMWRTGLQSLASTKCVSGYPGSRGALGPGRDPQIGISLLLPLP